MSFLQKTLASFGIGSAKVDAVIQQEVIVPGQTAQIIVHVYGGASAQEIDNIDLKLCCRYVAQVERNHNNHGHDNQTNKRKVKQTCVLDSWSLPYAFTINPGEEREFECELNVPWNTPITLDNSRVWLEVGLDINLGIDPKDCDNLTVRPDPVLEAILAALEEQGLRIRQAGCEQAKGFALPFVQEFEFVPVDGPFHGQWRELDMVVYREKDKLQLWFEVDRYKQGVAGMVSTLLGKGQLQRELTLDLPLPASEVGQQVVSYLTKTC